MANAPGSTAASSMETIILRSKDKLRIDERVEVRLAKALRARERRRVAAALAAATAAHASLVLFRFFRRLLFRKHLAARLERRRAKVANKRWWRVNFKVSNCSCMRGWCLVCVACAWVGNSTCLLTVIVSHVVCW
jgi:anti-sigma-K factor RskA